MFTIEIEFSEHKMMWTCGLCHEEEQIYTVTDGTLFVLHSCRCFGGTIASGRSKNMHRYVANLMSNQPVNITVFPLKR